MKLILLFIVLLGVTYYYQICVICSPEDENTSSNEDITNNESNSSENLEPSIVIPDDKWVRYALQDISYYLRNYKFNEWDRRYYNLKPENYGYYETFPIPALRSLHLKVFENCKDNFYKCIIYLHSVIETSPITRSDDIITILNKNSTSLNDSTIKILNDECMNAISNSEKSGLPFDGPIDKFQWRTSAAYYMCWYTMLGTPALALLAEPCDNFAQCLDPQYGYKNKDPRANDSIPYACALYSFCPDPCCPMKYIDNYEACYENDLNPCFTENVNNDVLRKTCSISKTNNIDFSNIILNRWNTSCHCNDIGFTWESEFEMCVDINECIMGSHNCNQQTENCLNIPGSFKCICRWEYSLDKNSVCREKIIFKNNKLNLKEHYYVISNIIQRILNYFGI